MKGIDVSSHNGSVDFNSVKNSGVETVYIKATEGTTFQDPNLNDYYNGAINAGLRVGFYHFLVGSSGPETQAENFYNQIKDKQNHLKPCLDIEHSSNEPCDFMDYALRFIARFNQLCNLPICIYSGPYFINDNLDGRLGNYPLWVANYGVDTPMSNNVWGSSYAGHQYTESGSIPGVCGNCDVNNFSEAILIDGSYTFRPQPAPQPINTDNIVYQLQQLINKQGFGPINEDGIPGSDTLAHCPTVREGANGQITQWIQLRIGTNPDGDFGPATTQAVIWFQQSRGIGADGIVGPDTWRQLLGL